MNILIIEDEVAARAKLVQMLSALDPECHIVGQLGSVKESVDWLRANPAPDLAFVDIQLSDDHSFEIFKQHPVRFPVVFTTAYDRYLLESFEYNSIDYVLKPLTEERLARSLAKMKNLQRHFIEGQLHQLIYQQPSPRQRRVVAKKGTEFVALEPDEIAYFYTEHKIVFVKDTHGRKLIVDHTLSELEEIVGENDFFRLNRKFLANIRSIEKFRPDNGKIAIQLLPPMNEEIHVSKDTAPAFRQWIGKTR